MGRCSQRLKRTDQTSNIGPEDVRPGARGQRGIGLERIQPGTRSDSGRRHAAARARAPYWTKVADEGYARPDDALTRTEDTDARRRAVAPDRLGWPTLDSVHGMR